MSERVGAVACMVALASAACGGGGTSARDAGPRPADAAPAADAGVAVVECESTSGTRLKIIRLGTGTVTVPDGVLDTQLAVECTITRLDATHAECTPASGPGPAATASVDEVSDGRIASARYRFADGAVVCTPSTGPYADRALGGLCTLALDPAGALRCMPDPAVASTATNVAGFRDPICTADAEAHDYDLAGFPGPPVGVRFASGQTPCGGPATSVLLQPPVDFVFVSSMGSCVAQPPALGHQYRVTQPTPAPAGSFATAERVFEAASATLERSYVSFEGGLQVQSHLFRMAGLDLPCTFVDATTGGLVCSPTFTVDAPAAQVVSGFSDMGCTVAASFVRTCQPGAVLASGSDGLHEVGAATTGYFVNGTACEAASVFTVGALVSVPVIAGSRVADP